MVHPETETVEKVPELVKVRQPIERKIVRQLWSEEENNIILQYLEENPTVYYWVKPVS